MTPKEQAEQLIDMFNPFTGYKYNTSKQCAILHAEGIIIELKKLEYYFKFDVIDPPKYWEQVKTEIENL